jgi:hypothetical protein
VKIFKSHGFDIDNALNYNKYIFSHKDNVTLSIGYSDPDEEISIGNLRSFYKSSKKDNADRLIYILPENYPNVIDRFAEDRNIQLWDRERFEREIGKALMVDIDTNGELLDWDEFFSADTKTSTQTTAAQSQTDDIIPIMVPLVSLEEDQDKDTDPTVQTDMEDISIIKPNISKDMVASMANKIVKGFRFNLELIPYYVFGFTCKFNLDDKTEDEDITTGQIGINGLTSNVEDWLEGVETVNELDEPHTKIEVKFPFDSALSLAKKEVMERNTRFIETKQEYDSTIIFEKKKLKPKPEAISIHNKGLYYLPVWCIEGSNGLMIIDSNSGKIIKEEIFKEA